MCRILQTQMKRVEDYEAWENVKKQEKAFIKTVKGSSKSILKNPNWLLQIC